MSVVDYKSSVVYIQKDGYVFRLKPETQVGQPLYDALATPVMDLRFSNSKTGDACWPIYAEQFMTNVWGEKKGVGSTLGDHAYRLTNAEQKANAEQYAREQADLALDTKITAEATTRGQQFQSLVNDLASEVATRQADVFQVQQSAQIEKNAREAADGVHSQHISDLKTQLASETATRASEDNKLTSGLNNEINRASLKETQIETALSAEVKSRQDLKTEFDAEVLFARSEEKKLSDRISFIVSNTDPAHIDSLSEIVASFAQSSGALIQRVAFLEGIVQELVDRSYA